MGYPKAMLPFGPETMLQRTVRTLSEVASPLVVVSAADQQLPRLPDGILLARDERPQLGPLEGIRTGLTTLAEKATAAEASPAYVTSCDVPFLTSAFVQHMAALLGDHEIAVPESDGFRHPLAAVYRTSIIPHIEELLSADRRRPVFLFDLVRTRIVQPNELMGVDPELRSLRNLNQPDDYRAALAEAGFELPVEIRRRFEQSKTD